MKYTVTDFKNDYIPEEDFIDGEDELSFAYTLNGAANGNAEYQFIMGELYSNVGHGVKINVQKAEYWYLQSAELGNGRAHCALGELYESGRLGEPDYQKAVYWLEKSAAQGNFRAADILAKIYFNRNDIEKARDYARQGAEGGYPSSYYFLALTHGHDGALYEEYLLKAVGLNCEQAFPRLFAFYLEEGKKEQAVHVYNLALQRGFGEIMERFADCL